MAYLGSSESKHYQGVYSIRKAYLGATQVIDDTVNGLLDFYGGASAAYSLRSLSAAWSSQDVVEVRRASDDTKAGFTATEVSDGTLTNWVNAEVALPLDTASGAAAAYSLRDLSVSRADLTVTDDTLPREFTLNNATGSLATYNGDIFEAIGKSYVRVGGDVSFNASSGVWTIVDTSDEFNPIVIPATAASDYPWTATWGGDLASATFDNRNTTGALVAQVRRSSDDEIKSFTAAEVAGSDMVDWVNTEGDLYDSARYFNGTNAQTQLDSTITLSGDFSISGTFLLSGDLSVTRPLTGVTGGNNRIAVSTSSGIAFIQIAGTSYLFNSLSIPSKDNTVRTFTVSRTGTTTTMTISGIGSESITTSSDSFLVGLIGRNGGGSQVWEGLIYDVNIDDQSAYTGLGTSVTAWQDTIGSNDGTETNGAAYTGQNAHGHVTKWYDQSGNDNHAVQTTEASQPKVVDAGTLVEINSAPAVLFEHSNLDRCFVELDPFYATGDDISAMVATERIEQGDWGTLIGYDNNNTSLPSAFSLLDSGYTRQPRANAGSGAVISTTVSENQPYIRSAFWDNSTLGLTTYVDGGDEQSGTGTTSVVAPPDKNRIGDYYTAGVFGKYTISEVILYNSDQSSNRKAIESNMADYHGNIDLPAGFDSGNDEVDGFVATWYDQSGNGNNAVQPVSTSQPKIVVNGDLWEDGIKFDGVNDYLYNATLTTSSAADTVAIVGTITANGGAFIDSHNSSSVTYARTVFNLAGDAKFSAYYNGLSDYNYGAYNSNQNLHFIVKNQYGSLNGVTDALNNGSATLNGIRIGISRVMTDPLDGTISEIIIYDSDQSDVRLGIEKEINDVYNIY